MANPLYNQLESNNTPQFADFLQNPFGFLMQKRGINIPQEMQSNPHDTVQFLLNNGQMNQNAFNKVFSRLQKMGFKFN